MIGVVGLVEGTVMEFESVCFTEKETWVMRIHLFSVCLPRKQRLGKREKEERVGFVRSIR